MRYDDDDDDDKSDTDDDDDKSDTDDDDDDVNEDAKAPKQGGVRRSAVQEKTPTEPAPILERLPGDWQGNSRRRELSHMEKGYSI